MLDKLKWYLINVGVQKYAPMAVMSALAWLGTYMMAHAGVLEQYGVTYGTWPFTWAAGQDPSGPCILIELDTLSTGGIAAVLALAAIAMRAAQHHSMSAPVAVPASNPGVTPQ